MRWRATACSQTFAGMHLPPSLPHDLRFRWPWRPYQARLLDTIARHLGDDRLRGRSDAGLGGPRDPRRSHEDVPALDSVGRAGDRADHLGRAGPVAGRNRQGHSFSSCNATGYRCRVRYRSHVHVQLHSVGPPRFTAHSPIHGNTRTAPEDPATLPPPTARTHVAARREPGEEKWRIVRRTSKERGPSGSCG